MTEGIPPSPLDEPIGGASPRGQSWSIGPEVLAAAVSLALIVTITVGVLSGARLPGLAQPGDTPGPTPTSPDRALPTSAPTVNVAAVEALLQIDERLATDREALKAELAGSLFDPADVSTILRGVNADVLQASDIVGHLGPSAAAASLSAILSAFYTGLHDEISAALVNSVHNAPAYHAAATSVVKTLDQLADHDARLRALLLSALTPTPVPSASAAPSPSPGSPSAAPPSSGPSASPTPLPISPSPGASGSQVPGGILVNPGFEAGVGAPWELVLGPTAQATFQQDLTVRNTGRAAGRVDISAAGEERAAVAVRQGGLGVEAGSRYLATVAVRADSTREVRFRIASAAGDTYGTRLFTVGPAWQVISVDTTIFATDANAYLEIDLGRFATTTWLDDASFVQLPATGG